MNEEVKKYLAKIVEEEHTDIPEYAFTIRDYINELVSQGGKEISRTTARDRLNKRVAAGELITIRPTHSSLYYVPKHLARNAEIDEKAILNS